MANGFDFSNIGQMFSGAMPGVAPSGIDALLTEDQRRLLGRNAALAAASALLQASGPSAQRIGLGQALGSALQAGQAGYQQARAGALQDVMLGEKLKESQRATQLQQQLAGVFTTPPATLTPAQQALASPGGQVGPTVQRAEIMQGMEGPTDAQIKAAQYQRAADILAAAGRVDQAKQYQEMADRINPRDEVVGQPFEVTDATGKPVMVQQFKSGKLQTMAGFGPKREVVLQNLGGQTVAVNKSALRGGETFQQTLTPAEAGNLAVSQGQLRVAQGNLGLRQQEVARGAYDRVETADGIMYVPKTPGGAAVPVMGPTGQPVKGVSGGQPTEGERKAATLLQRLQLAEQQMTAPTAGAAPRPFSDVTPRVLKPEERKRTEDAQLEFLDAALTLSTGAAYTREQLLGAQQSYFPKFGDSPETIAEKALRRQQLIESARTAAGRMSAQVPPLPARPTPVAPAPATQRPARLQFDPATNTYRYIQE